MSLLIVLAILSGSAYLFHRNRKRDAGFWVKPTKPVSTAHRPLGYAGVELLHDTLERDPRAKPTPDSVKVEIKLDTEPLSTWLTIWYSPPGSYYGPGKPAANRYAPVLETSRGPVSFRWYVIQVLSRTDGRFKPAVTSFTPGQVGGVALYLEGAVEAIGAEERMGVTSGLSLPINESSPRISIEESGGKMHVTYSLDSPTGRVMSETLTPQKAIAIAQTLRGLDERVRALVVKRVESAHHPATPTPAQQMMPVRRVER